MGQLNPPLRLWPVSDFGDVIWSWHCHNPVVASHSSALALADGLDISFGALMNEHRAAPRHRILKAGTISFGGGAIDCTVRNLSETGAALEVVTPLFIPDRFTLIVQTEQLKRPCRIVWRKEKRMGVAFD